jgi:glycine reductase complex component B subunit gamma
MNKTFRVVHYLNQFFGQIGGEDKADTKPFAKDGAVGPGLAFAPAFSDEANIVGTVICGDSYFNENTEEAGKEILSLISEFAPDIVIAGPAFNAGRYGVACGWVAKAVQDQMQIPAVTGMYEENPGVEIYQKTVYIVPTSDSAAGMRKAVPIMSRLALKLVKQEPLGTAEEEGYMDRGAVRKNYIANERGAKRAVDMLIAKLKGEPFTTEYPMPKFDRVFPQPAIESRKKAKIALVTSGGIVPKGNPDKIEASSASKFGKYPLADLLELTKETHETAHGGYDPVYANEDPDRVVPLDVMRELEEAGDIGALHPYFYSTVGNGTSVANAKRFAESIAHELVNEGVQAVILTST